MEKGELKVIMMCTLCWVLKNKVIASLLGYTLFHSWRPNKSLVKWLMHCTLLAICVRPMIFLVYFLDFAFATQDAIFEWDFMTFVSPKVFFFIHPYTLKRTRALLVQTTHRKKNEAQQIKRSPHCQQKSQQKNPSGLTTKLTSPDIQKEFVQAACIKRDTATVPWITLYIHFLKDGSLCTLQDTDCQPSLHMSPELSRST